MTYEIKINEKPKTWNAFVGNRTNWAYYAYKKNINMQIRVAVRQVGLCIFVQPVRATFVIGYSSRRRSDIDSLCLKPYLDSLVTEGVLSDDNRFVVKDVRITWEESKEEFTKIIIEEL